METVNCLWIIINAPVGLQNRTYSLDTCYREIGGSDTEDSSGLCHISCVYVGNPDEKGISGLSRIVDILFFEKTVNQRNERLEQCYKIVLDDSTQRELNKMSFMSDYVEGAIDVAREDGMIEGRILMAIDCVVTLVTDQSWNIDKAIEILKVPDEYADRVRTEATAILSHSESQ